MSELQSVRTGKCRNAVFSPNWKGAELKRGRIWKGAELESVRTTQNWEVSELPKIGKFRIQGWHIKILKICYDLTNIFSTEDNN